MDLKIEKHGPTVVMISLNNESCLLSNETVVELQNAETIGPFQNKLVIEIMKQNVEMAEALKGLFKNPPVAFEIMDKIKAFTF
ncbi:MAG: hypothetical protein HY096_11090 [Nitrospinae bacterium]|nr:hypothetical protein [Nitrospinota bacterium]